MNYSFLIHFLQTEPFWKAVAFIAVVFIMLIPVCNFVSKKMGQYSLVIQNNIQEAIKLYSNAETLLNYQRNQNKEMGKEKVVLLRKVKKTVKILENKDLESLRLRQKDKEKEIVFRVKMMGKNHLKELSESVLKFATQTVSLFSKRYSRFKKEDLFFNQSFQELEDVLNNQKEVEKLL